MIVENIKITNNHRIKVTRICDCCGEKEKTHLGIIYGGRKSRENDKDYCKKCSYKYRRLNQPKMEQSPSWKGGRYLSDNGYYRIYMGNLKYEYEHKVILSKYLNRKLSVEEKVHHIDLNKVNNNISNLYLCKNKRTHWYCHQSMEECGFSLLNKKIWFDLKTKKYIIDKSSKLKSKLKINIDDIMKLNVYKSRRRKGGKEYLRPTKKEFRSSSIHVLIAERMIGRKLFSNEVVHHINGNTLDNNPNNLCIITRSEHKKCHFSLQDCISILFEKKYVKFKDGKYITKGTKNG